MYSINNFFLLIVVLILLILLIVIKYFFWIRMNKIERQINYLLKGLDDKNYRLYKAKMKAEEQLKKLTNQLKRKQT